MLYAGVTGEDAKNMILNQILAEEIGSVNVFSFNDVKTKQDYIEISDRQLSCPYQLNWVFFVDDDIYANWGHPCRYIFINKENGDYQIINETLPPLNTRSFENISKVNFTRENKLKTDYDVTIPTGKAPDDHKFAVIINGGYNNYWNRIRYWNDTSAIYCTLTQVYGYKPDNIHVHSTNGTVDSNYGSLDLDGPDVRPNSVDIRYPAFKSNIRDTFESLAHEIGPDDQLFVYVTDHGDIQNRIVLWGTETISAPELDDMLDPIKASEIIVVMEQCYGGGFITNNDNITDPHRVIHTATSATKLSWVEGWITGFEYDEFVFYWTSAARGFYPGNHPYSPGYYTVGNFPFRDIGIVEFNDHPLDYDPDDQLYGGNGDGFVQMEEAFAYADNFDTWSGLENPDDNYYKPISDDLRHEIPVSFNDIGFNEDLLSLNGLCGNVTKSNTISGNYLINPDLALSSYVSLTVGQNSLLYNNGIFTLAANSTLYHESNSELILLDESVLIIDFESELIFAEDSKILVEGNAKIIGDIQMADGVNIVIQENSTLNLQLSNLAILPNSTLKLAKNSKLVIGNGTELIVNDGAIIELAEGAEIIVMNKGKLEADGTTFSYVDGSGNWQGIIAEVGSSVILSNTNISNAVCGLNASASNVNVTSSSFTDCENGVSL
ncbi:MAG: caspase family protein, partial [Candidatus Delongbacteria bacterium]|nr:caspase family protein [Candidatus Delongbacteria bacterium]